MSPKPASRANAARVEPRPGSPNQRTSAVGSPHPPRLSYISRKHCPVVQLPTSLRRHRSTGGLPAEPADSDASPRNHSIVERSVVRGPSRSCSPLRRRREVDSPSTCCWRNVKLTHQDIGISDGPSEARRFAHDLIGDRVGAGHASSRHRGANRRCGTRCWPCGPVPSREVTGNEHGYRPRHFFTDPTD